MKNTVITTQGEGPQQYSEKPPAYPEHTNTSFEPLFTNTLIVPLGITACKVQQKHTSKAHLKKLKIQPETGVMVMASLSVYSVTEPLGLTLGTQCTLETV